MHESELEFVSIPEISAIYYALLQCGYDFYSIQRDEGHVRALRGWMTEKPHPFWEQVRQRTCQVYPYWPRAALLETAVFYLQPGKKEFADFARYRKWVMAAGNITDEERNEAFFAWLEGFTGALSDVMESKGFREYSAWRRAWLSEQHRMHRNALEHVKNCLNVCVSLYASPVREIGILLDPIKCAYSADYHLLGETFYYSSGLFNPESVIHEFLHPVVHPIVKDNCDWILRCCAEYPGIDASYYLDGGETGRLNAFEEYAVRCLTKRAMIEELPQDLGAFLHQVATGLD